MSCCSCYSRLGDGIRNMDRSRKAGAICRSDSKEGSSYYSRTAYDSKGRFASYWHQITEIADLAPSSILEIGIGNGLTASCLRRRGFSLVALDVDEHLSPEVVGCVVALPFPDESFEMVACFEVLEHLPYEGFSRALGEIHRVSMRNALLSLPDSTRACRFDVQIPKLGELKRLILLPQLRAPAHQFDGEHYWEIGKASYALRRVMHDIGEAEFHIVKTYRVFEMPYHRFFVLAKGK